MTYELIVIGGGPAGYLADGQVSRPGMVVFDSLVFPCGLDGVEHGLKLTDDGHVAIDAKEILSGEIGFLLLYGFVVLINRYVLKFDISALSYLSGIDKL
jgi:hypothetical protein